MSSVKPCLASKPRAFMTFHTSGLNTGSVRLETLITGFCCACADGIATSGKGESKAANAARPRRDSLDMDIPPGGSFQP